MCQLLAMNANTPTDIVFSFDGFRRRGGLTDCHSDGFGIAFFEDNALRLLQDTTPCATSPFADMVKKCPIRSTNIIAHIRRAKLEFLFNTGMMARKSTMIPKPPSHCVMLRQNNIPCG